MSCRRAAETYIHRIGRTGRAGHRGAAISLVETYELPELKQIEKLLQQPIGQLPLPDKGNRWRRQNRLFGKKWMRSRRRRAIKMRRCMRKF